MRRWLGRRRGAERTDDSGRPWYAHEDRWEISARWRESADGEFLVLEPKRFDPAFGPQVEVRLRDTTEVYVSSDEDDGRFVIPLPDDAVRRLERDLAVALAECAAPGLTAPATCPTCGRDLLVSPEPSVRVRGLPRPLYDDEGTFLLRALRQAGEIPRSERTRKQAHKRR